MRQSSSSLYNAPVNNHRVVKSLSKKSTPNHPGNMHHEHDVLAFFQTMSKTLILGTLENSTKTKIIIKMSNFEGWQKCQFWRWWQTGWLPCLTKACRMSIWGPELPWFIPFWMKTRIPNMKSLNFAKYKAWFQISLSEAAPGVEDWRPKQVKGIGNR